MSESLTDKYYRVLSEFYKKYGDPKEFAEKYLNGEKISEKILQHYDNYKLGILKEVIAAGLVPKIQVHYTGDIDELINTIINNPNFDNVESIFIPNDINNLDHLKLLKNRFPNKNIILNYHGELCFIDNAISAKYMIDYYKSIIDDDLSPLEKITIAYDIAKSHNYKYSNVKESMESRYITKMVNNDNIVCSGFAKIFETILKELGIRCLELSLSLDDDEEELGHARNMVIINDDKYNVHGLFVFDPTFDSADKACYYRIDGDVFQKSKEKQEGYKKSDSLSLYKYFLIPTYCYEKRFNSSRDEKVDVNFDNTRIQSILHTNQIDEIVNLPDMTFVKLLYTTKLAEGYSRKELPGLIQEIFFVNYDNKYTLEAIEEAINEIEQSDKEEMKMSA